MRRGCTSACTAGSRLERGLGVIEIGQRVTQEESQQPRSTAGQANDAPAPINELDLKLKVAEVLDRWPSAGLAVVLVRDGSLEWFLRHGIADVESKEPITEDT